MDRVKTICLIGSSRFKEDFHRIGYDLEKQGILILMMSFFQHSDQMSVSEEERLVLNMVDNARIDLSDEVLVINPRVYICKKCGKPNSLFYDVILNVYLTMCCKGEWEYKYYWGESTSREIEYAKSKGKTVSYLVPLE